MHPFSVDSDRLRGALQESLSKAPGGKQNSSYRISFKNCSAENGLGEVMNNGLSGSSTGFAFHMDSDTLLPGQV